MVEFYVDFLPLARSLFEWYRVPTSRQLLDSWREWKLIFAILDAPCRS
ncbi:hypothetical protein PROAA_2000008 [Candidatus Propionivibrio aalborgensis]|uniref:Uncharacterized protein n=1 Tax=Candidatus Propionivibrio aalborgensis TaxID=1860101 RepID=A0A1A8XP82_9RHOO|nr:hypothetical protein PROAA_2000008 [Candidatus Propionivibrio aalborgensis]